jgi:hypothetical protein
MKTAAVEVRSRSIPAAVIARSVPNPWDDAMKSP